jgi:hypothetical protein
MHIVKKMLEMRLLRLIVGRLHIVTEDVNDFFV